MKTLTTYTKTNLWKCLTLALSLSLVACGGGDEDEDPGPTKKDEVTIVLLSGIWKVSNVTVNGVDKTEVYEGMTLKFSSSNYTTTTGRPVWPASGTWAFTSENATAFRRDDGVVVDIAQATNSSLQLGLTWDETTLGSGRLESVEGKHVFTFVK